MDADTFVQSAPVGSTLRRLDGQFATTAPSGRLNRRMENAEREEILRAMEQVGGVRKKAAELLGISYRGLGKKMIRLGIENAGRDAKSAKK